MNNLNVQICDDDKAIVDALEIYLKHEGSGLGLSIAQSLTQLQEGSFRIDIDGDLFKATVEIPLWMEAQS